MDEPKRKTKQITQVGHITVVWRETTMGQAVYLFRDLDPEKHHGVLDASRAVLAATTPAGLDALAQVLREMAAAMRLERCSKE